MLRSHQKPSPSELKKIGRELRDLCSKNPLDGASADKAIAIIREYKNYPEVINSHSFGGMTPIMLVYKTKSLLNDAITEELLKTDCVDITRVYRNNDTILHIAADRGDDKFAEMLLAKNAIDINARNKNGVTALMYAAKLKSGAQVAALLKYPHIDINAHAKNGMTALIEAVKHSLKASELLLQHPKISVNDIYTEDELKTNALCEAILSPALNEDIWVPHNERESRINALIQMLVNKGADLSFRYYGAARMTNTWVKSNSFFAENDYIYKKVYSLNENNGATPLILAAAVQTHLQSMSGIVRILLDANADLNLHDDSGQTAEQRAKFDAIKTMLQEEIPLRAARWPRRKNTILARSYFAMGCHDYRVPKGVTALIANSIYVDAAPDNTLTQEDKDLLKAHNNELIDNAYKWRQV